MRTHITEDEYHQFKEELANVAPDAWAIRLTRCHRCRKKAYTYRTGRINRDVVRDGQWIRVHFYCPNCKAQAFALRDVES